MNATTPQPRNSNERISQEIEAVGKSGGWISPIRVKLTYQLRHPYSVQACLSTGDDGATWTISREVLCQAALWDAPAGMGDFTASPWSAGLVRLEFNGIHPESRQRELLMVIDVPQEVLSAFLLRTLHVVPAGRESVHLGLDAALAALFGTNVRED